MQFMKKFICLILMIFAFTSCQKATVNSSDFKWKPYSNLALAEAIDQKKPVVIDFWAQWCPNCHDLDREVFSRPDIQAKLAKVVALRMDVTNQDDPAVQKIIDQYGIEGVPTIVFLDSKGVEIPNSRVIGFVTAQEFSQAFALLALLK